MMASSSRTLSNAIPKQTPLGVKLNLIAEQNRESLRCLLEKQNKENRSPNAPPQEPVYAPLSKHFVISTRTPATAQTSHTHYPFIESTRVPSQCIDYPQFSNTHSTVNKTTLTTVTAENQPRRSSKPIPSFGPSPRKVNTQKRVTISTPQGLQTRKFIIGNPLFNSTIHPASVNTTQPNTILMPILPPITSEQTLATNSENQQTNAPTHERDNIKNAPLTPHTPSCRTIFNSPPLSTPSAALTLCKLFGDVNRTTHTNEKSEKSRKRKSTRKSNNLSKKKIFASEDKVQSILVKQTSTTNVTSYPSSIPHSFIYTF
eukprot:TRINITY_DN5620_c0_g2_i1.p1 TRINITY_DN5620_c0_g2~~TRINITY_DN5620_c0_g2_i1.p1  ORF type:complete len:316 (+),score=74.93 TRINITY_DN5620_c0_g2_i1:119-1066(+)